MPQAVVAKTFGAIVVETKLIFFISKVSQIQVSFSIVAFTLEMKRIIFVSTTIALKVLDTTDYGMILLIFENSILHARMDKIRL